MPEGTVPERLRGLLDLPGARLALLVALFCTFAFPKLGGSGLAVWDDAYYACKAKEVLRTGDWVTMHYDGRPMFDNPPGFMWLMALSFRVWGANEYGAKFPSAVFGLLTVVLLYLLGRSIRGDWYGFLSAGVLCLTQPFVRYSRRGMMDVVLTFFVVLAALAAWRAGEGRRKWLYAWGLAAGGAIMLKSVLGLFALAVPLAWIVLAGRRELLRSKELYLGLLLALAVGGWWFLAEYLRHGREFLEVHFGWIVLRRSFVVSEGGGWAGHLSYLRDLAKYYWPWLPVSLCGLWPALSPRPGKAEKEGRLLAIIWAVAYLVVLSLMKARRLWYLMPAFPALALLAALALQRWLGGERARRAVVTGLAAMALVAGAAINFTPLRMDKPRTLEVRSLAPYVRHYAALGHRVVGYRLDYFALNSGLIFYGGVSANPIYNSESELDSALSAGQPTVCVTEAPSFGALPAALRGRLILVKQYGSTMLLTNGDLLPDTLSVVP